MRPATDGEIKTGYLLTNWRHALDKVMWAFSRPTMDAYRAAKENLVDTEQIALGQQFGESEALLFDACKAPAQVGHAHNVARLVLKGAGIRTIKNEDFVEYEKDFDFSELGQYGADIVQDINGSYYLKIPIGGGGCRVVGWLVIGVAAALTVLNSGAVVFVA